MTSAPPAVRIVVADDHHVVRTGFAALLDTQPDFAVVGTACDGTEAVQICRELSPDVVLMDVRMPVMDGIEATRQLAGSGPDGSPGPRILILTTFDLDRYVYDALCAGASGFLLKDVTAERLFEAVRVIAAGEALLAPAVTRRLISEFTRLRPRPEALATGALATLTPRETQVLRLVAEGLSNPGDSRPPGRHRGDGQVARKPDAGQARVARPDPGGGHRLRAGPGRSRLEGSGTFRWAGVMRQR